MLDPGLSFGTGQHPTTAFCLEELVRRRDSSRSSRFWTSGPGRESWAVAAAALGYRPVQAFDFDADAVKMARCNARQNGVGRRIQIERQDVLELSRSPVRRHTVVAANLISNLLIAERHRVIAQLAADGLLVLAGILKVEFAEVQQAYEGAGLYLVTSRAKGEWRSGSFTFS